MSEPFFSILCATWNGAAFIAKAIESVRCQEFVDWEMVVVDDGSDDATYARACEAASDDRRIRIVRNHIRIGKVAVFVQTFPIMRGVVGMEVDGDDWLASPQALGIIHAAYAADDELDATCGAHKTNWDLPMLPGIADPGRPRYVAAHAAIHAPRTWRRTVMAQAFREMPEVFYRSSGRTWESCGDLVLFSPILHLARKIRWLEDVLYIVNRDNPYSDFVLIPKVQQDVAQDIIDVWRRIEHGQSRG